MPTHDQAFYDSLVRQLTASSGGASKQFDVRDAELDVHDVHLERTGIEIKNVLRNPSAAVLYEHGLRYEKGTAITDKGAMAVLSGHHTGRSPKDKRIVKEPSTENDVWWGRVNIPMKPETFRINRERAIDYLNMVERLYVIDGFAGWDERYRFKIRIICDRAYHALFMKNMLIRPSQEELATFGEPDFVIYNAGRFPANRYTEGMTSSASVAINFAEREMVILGTEYAGEMKKGVFTIMHYLMPKQGILSLHSSANEGSDGNVSLFFGLSGTGKTTLSADPHRSLIGDDEHCWSENGIFNIEGGCYAKCINLSRDKEPEIYDALRFGSVLENVVMDVNTRAVDYDNQSITENTRASYPIEYIPNAKIPCIGGHPNHVILLTCDAFGVLPPVARLTEEQTMYHFISGYTAKVAGTEVGITEPQATFSACFGEPFLVWHPAVYARMLADKLKHHSATAWLVNTGWTGGPYGKGHRLSIKHTRAILDAIHSGELSKVEYTEFPIFDLHVPKTCPGVPTEALMPENTWSDKTAYKETLRKLALLFHENFEAYKDKADAAIVNAGPKI